MFLDARSFVEDSLITDVCIIGSGPAGLTLATEMAQSGVRILLIENGGMNFDADRQSLLNGTDVTGEYHNPRDSRCSQFGGAVQIWNTPVGPHSGAKYVPLDELDFEKRDWVPHSGWPLDREDLRPYYSRAEKICGLPEPDYDAIHWEGGRNCRISFADNEVVTKVYKLGSSESFLQSAKQCIATSENIRCLLWATAVELVPAAGATRVESLRIVTPSRKQIKVRARIFVLAAGGIENPRLLLSSNRHWRTGIGNSNDLVGRFLMDHPIYYFTELIPDSATLFNALGFYDVHTVDGSHVLGRLTLSAETLRKHKLLNLSVVFYPKRRGYRSKGVEALRQMRFRLREKQFGAALRFGPQLCTHGLDLIAYAWRRSECPSSALHLWSTVPNLEKAFRTFEPEFYLEQPPDPANRVSLASSKDGIGLPKTLITWKWGEQSKQSAEEARVILDRRLQKAQIGRLRLLDFPRLNPSAHHHLGTTRMHSVPREGVVDENCRVHETDNLYIAGGSVFPTAGSANPTLTIVALSTRLADHLKKLLDPLMTMKP